MLPHGLYSPPGSSVHGISQTIILEWVAVSFSRGSFWLRDQTCNPCLAGRFFTTEVPWRYIYIYIYIHINICLYTKICNTEGTCITSVFSHTKIKYWWTSECNPLLNPYFKVRMILRCEQIYILMPWFRYFIFNSCFQSTSSQCCHMLIYGNNDLHLKAIS